MRKIFIALSALLALATACTVEPLPQVKEEAKGKFTIIASTGSETKTEITDKGKVSWQESDAIDIYDGQFNKFTFDGLDENGNGIFKGDLGNAEGMLLAVYPSGIGSEVAGRRLSMVLPGSYEYDGDNTHTPMLSSRVKMDQTTARVSFKHLGGLIKITYDNVPEEAVEFVFSATKQISGRFQIEDYMAENVVIVSSETETDDDKTVRYPIGEDHPSKMSFYVPVPTGTFGFNIAILDSEGVAIEGSSKKKSSISIERGAYFNIPTITLPIIEKDGYKKISSLDEFESGDYVIVAHVEQENSFEIKGDYALPNSLIIKGKGKIDAGTDISAKIKNNLISVEDGEPYKLLISGSTDSLTVSNGEKSLSYGTSTNLSTGGANTAWVLSQNEGNGGTFILINKSTTIGEEPKARALLLQLYSNSTTKTMVFGAYDVKTNVNAKDYSTIELYKRVYGESPIEHKAYFSVNGAVVESLTRTVNQGTKIEFPATPSVSGGTFQGWIKHEIDGVQESAPSMIDTNNEKMGAEDVTYYAVFTTSGVERTSTWAVNGVTKPAEAGNEVKTTLKTSSVTPESETGVWTAIAPNSYAATSSGKAQLGSGSYKFAGTISLSGSSIPSEAFITQISLSATSNATDANPYSITASIGGQLYGNAQNLSSGNPDCQWSGVGKGSNIVLTTSCGYNKNIIISAISVKYKLEGVGYCTTLPGSEDPGISVSKIEVKTNPTQTSYTEGELFKAAGLVITVTYSDTMTEDISYDLHKDDFSFNPGLSTALTTADTSIQVTYAGKSVTIPIYVQAAQTGVATWLDNYEFPSCTISAISTSNTRYNGYYCHNTVNELYGGQQACVYNTPNNKQKVVVHTFSYNGKILNNYAMLFDGDKRCALWEAYRYTVSDYPDKSVGRNEKWDYDPALDKSWQPLLSSSYSDGNYDRGHQVGSGDRQTTVEQNKQTFYYSNMTPQFNKLNQGQWGVAENAIQLASTKLSGSDVLLVVTGPLFTGTVHYTKDNAGKDCAIPQGYFKCAMKCTFNSAGAMTGAKGCAYIVETNSSNTAATLTSIDYVENKCGFDLFHNVPDEYENAAEAQNTIFWN